MFCGNCFRDNQMVAELRKLGHQVLMIPLYLRGLASPGLE